MRSSSRPRVVKRPPRALAKGSTGAADDLGDRCLGRLMMTSFGCNDAGGGTTVPRLAAKELARRGWEVTVFHAAVQLTASRRPYELHEMAGGRRPPDRRPQPSARSLRHQQPASRAHDPPITSAFAAALDRLRARRRALSQPAQPRRRADRRRPPSAGSPPSSRTHNYWLICPRAYLMDGAGEDLRRTR